MFYIKTFLLVFWLLFCCAVISLVAVFRWGDTNLNHAYAKLLSTLAPLITGIRVVVENPERLEAFQPCVYVANHQDNYDFVTFGALFPRRTVVIGKKELGWIPIFNIFFRGAGNVLLDRKKRTRAVASLNQVIEVIEKKKASVFIFPEGTRNQTGEGFLPFKKGAFHMAISAGVPIVPMVVSSMRERIRYDQKRIIPGEIRVRILEPVSTQGMKASDVDVLSANVRSKMIEAFHGLSTSSVNS